MCNVLNKGWKILIKISQLGGCALQVGNVATVRQYQEAIVVNIMLREPDLVQEHVLPALLAYENR